MKSKLTIKLELRPAVPIDQFLWTFVQTCFVLPIFPVATLKRGVGSPQTCVRSRGSVNERSMISGLAATPLVWTWVWRAASPQGARAEDRYVWTTLFKPKFVLSLVGRAIVSHSTIFDNLPHPSPYYIASRPASPLGCGSGYKHTGCRTWLPPCPSGDLQWDGSAASETNTTIPGSPTTGAAKGGAWAPTFGQFDPYLLWCSLRTFPF